MKTLLALLVLCSTAFAGELPTTQERLVYAIHVMVTYAEAGDSGPYNTAYLGFMQIKYLKTGLGDPTASNWKQCEKYMADIVAKDPEKGIIAVERAALHILRQYHVGHNQDTTLAGRSAYQKAFDTLRVRAGLPTIDPDNQPEPQGQAEAEAIAAKEAADNAKAAKAALDEMIKKAAETKAKAAQDKIDKAPLYKLKDGRSFHAMTVIKAGDDLVIKDEHNKMITVKADDVESIDGK